MATEAIANTNTNTKKPKDMSKRKRHRDYIFVAVLLAYPVLQFVITWVFVNIGALRLAFIRVDLSLIHI